MRRKNNKRTALISMLILFVTVAFVTTVTLLVYGGVADALDGNKAAISGIMFSVIFVLSVLGTSVDILRRRYTVDKPVQKILDATDRIAAGNFDVRLETAHTFGRYDEYDYIMENINKMAAELRKTEVLNEDFISNVSHELKTPLAVIQSYAASLRNKNLDSETRIKYAETLGNAAHRLTTLVTNILKLNKLENREINIEYERINLNESLAEAALGFEEIIESKGLNLDCDLEEDVFVFSSPSYLEIVWSNLISNAVKFTERGGDIKISLRREGENAVVKVEDSGCGISPDIGRHIFEKFYQGDTSHSREGNGLGLALVKKVIDIIGGTISVSSELGKGTAFTVSIRGES